MYEPQEAFSNSTETVHCGTFCIHFRFVVWITVVWERILGTESRVESQCWMLMFRTNSPKMPKTYRIFTLVGAYNHPSNRQVRVGGGRTAQCGLVQSSSHSTRMFVCRRIINLCHDSLFRKSCLTETCLDFGIFNPGRATLPFTHSPPVYQPASHPSIHPSAYASCVWVCVNVRVS